MKTKNFQNKKRDRRIEAYKANSDYIKQYEKPDELDRSVEKKINNQLQVLRLSRENAILKERIEKPIIRTKKDRSMRARIIKWIKF